MMQRVKTAAPFSALAQLSSIMGALAITLGLLIGWCLGIGPERERREAPIRERVREVAVARIAPKLESASLSPDRLESESPSDNLARLPLPEPIEVSSLSEFGVSRPPLSTSIDMPRAPQAQLRDHRPGQEVRNSSASLSAAPNSSMPPRSTPVAPGQRARAPSRSGPFGAGEVDTGPRARGKQAAPAYPSRLQRRARPPEGSVTLRFVVDAQGRVRDIEVESSRGPRAFRQAAREAVASWAFHPAHKNGRAVAVRARKTFEFRGKAR